MYYINTTAFPNQPVILSEKDNRFMRQAEPSAPPRRLQLLVLGTSHHHLILDTGIRVWTQIHRRPAKPPEQYPRPLLLACTPASSSFALVFWGWWSLREGMSCLKG